MAIIVEPAAQHGNIMKRLKETLEANKKQLKLIMDSESGMHVLLKADIPLISSHSYRSEEGQES